MWALVYDGSVLVVTLYLARYCLPLFSNKIVDNDNGSLNGF